MSFAERWLSRLPLSDSSQRSLMEAAADWHHEVATASSLICVVRAHLFGTVSVLRLLTSVIADSAIPALHWSWLLSLAVWTAVLSIMSAHRLDAYLMLGVRMAVPLAILFGPARRRSPVIGLGIVQVFVSAFTAIAMPRESTALMVQATCGVLVACVVADRIRTDVRRELRTLQLAGLLLMIWSIALPGVVSLRTSGVAEAPVEHALWAWFTSCLVASWYWIVRQQETRFWWAQAELWRQCQGEHR